MLDKLLFSLKYSLFFLFFSHKCACGYSLQIRGTFNEYRQHVFVEKQAKKKPQLFLRFLCFFVGFFFCFFFCFFFFVLFMSHLILSSAFVSYRFHSTICDTEDQSLTVMIWCWTIDLQAF